MDTNYQRNIQFIDNKLKITIYPSKLGSPPNPPEKGGIFCVTQTIGRYIYRQKI